MLCVCNFFKVYFRRGVLYGFCVFIVDMILFFVFIEYFFCIDFNVEGWNIFSYLLVLYFYWVDMIGRFGGIFKIIFKIFNEIGGLIK